MSKVRDYLLKWGHMNAVLAVSAPVNYAVVVLLVVYFHFSGWWVLGPVVLGDIAGYTVNVYLSFKTGLVRVRS